MSDKQIVSVTATAGAACVVMLAIATPNAELMETLGMLGAIVCTLVVIGRVGVVAVHARAEQQLSRLEHIAANVATMRDDVARQIAAHEAASDCQIARIEAIIERLVAADLNVATALRHGTVVRPGLPSTVIPLPTGSRRTRG
ncbi:hypothetical protein amrb99_97800 [Actinomadura sp. RB99]|uniref:hypothetical protein n=1 Tax=Actinomadura sp. RB99 TaxID=2691577 RepID=UPI0016836D1F|nr:hypothetical protein [Actinomadura sp. RB99]MBD2900771.1 hypothetical protein [Actinomadura sp. RB99]